MFSGCGFSSPKVLEGLEPEIIAKPRILSPPKFDKTQYCPIPELDLVHPLERPYIPEIHVHVPDMNEELLVGTEVHPHPSDQLGEKLPTIPEARLLHPLDRLYKKLSITSRIPRLRPLDRLNKRLPTIPENSILLSDRLNNKLPPLPHETI